MLALLLVLPVIGGPFVPSPPDEAATAAGLYDDADADSAPLPPLQPGLAVTVILPGPDSVGTPLGPGRPSPAPAPAGPVTLRTPRAPPAA